jgi:lipopolysaccharide assembly outer membrane protein LptD (OstA)
MTRLLAILTFALGAVAFSGRGFAQQDEMALEPGQMEIRALNDQGWAEVDLATGIATGTNGVMFRYGGAVVTAERMTVDENSGDVSADGRVHIQREEQIWAGEHIRYNYQTHQIEAEQFRTGKNPVFIEGEGLHGDTSNKVYVATNAFITTEDLAQPVMKVRAKRIKIIPGKRVEARHATLYVGGVPMFYFPYYSRNIGPRANNFNFVPGYRSSYGPFLLSSYHWFLGDDLDGALHLDYRERRGLGGGPDVNYHLGQWGDGSIKYYYLHDLDPNESLTNSISKDRERFYYSYLANPFTNFNVRSVVRYQSDLGVEHDFFESQYRENPQPTTFVEANKYWQNFSLDLYVQPRINDFYETVERLPDVRLTGFRQQIGETPLFYESESSAGYYKRLFAETNSLPPTPAFAATRADTYHQILLPETFFGWLNITPRAGERLTYYSDASGAGATTHELTRSVFNTGAEVSFKASRVWPGVQNKIFEVDGLRHIIEPSVNYVYVPNPNYAGTNQIPQFDYQSPSLRLLPIDFPDYNSIDSVDSQNVIRLGLHNKLQTKRGGEVVNLASWDLYTDWRIKPQRQQNTFADLYSDVVLRPRSWLTLESLTRFNIEGGECRMALDSITIHPNDVWSWSLGQYYLQDNFDPETGGWGDGNNLFSSTLFYRLNDNWGFRAAQRYNARNGRLEEQDYTIYRDLRSWTAALTLRYRQSTTGPDDFGVAFTFSLKAFPRFGLGSDTAHATRLLGS